jgi:DNA helicase II / ATP-dependent DNA helicase PcrA
MTQTPPEERVLNQQQKQAVEFGDGPLMIIAGAGTGKTTVVTERIRHLITSELALPSEVLALTFTEKAAKEMEERVDMLLPYGYTQMWISTFHKFCDRVLRSEAIHIGLNPAYRLLTEADATMLLRKQLFSFDLEYFRPLGNPSKFIGGLLTHFSRLHDEDISPASYIAWAKKQKGKSEEEQLEVKKYLELAHAYEAYETLKAKEGVMDFSDLITNTLKLFRTRPNVLKEYQSRFKYILVDEFQDTNIAQNELIVLLSGPPAQAGKKQNITVVCDDDQSIYKFRGAAVSNVLSFRKHFPKTQIIVLSQNYRSTQEILDSSYTLIQHNNPDRLEIKEGINKRLVAQRKVKGSIPRLLYLDRVENEADAVIKEIKNVKLKMKNEHEYQWKDFAILLRANNHAEPFVRACIRHGIPFQFLGPGQLFRQPEVKDLIAYLQVLDAFDQNVSLFRVLSMEYFDLSARDIAAISNFSKRSNLSLFEACEIVTEQRAFTGAVPLIEEKTQQTLRQLVGIMHKHLGLVTRESGGQLLFYFLEETGMMKSILEHKLPLDERKANNIAKFFGKLKTYEVEHEDASVSSLLDWIMLSMELGESPLATDTDWSENDAVNLLTVHSAKGLEFPVVFLVNLVSQRFPSTQRREQIPIPEGLIKESLPVGDYHLQEERRLFYVGMTRARDALYFTAANFYGEGKRDKKLSPFISEVFGSRAFAPEEPAESQLSLLDWKKPADAEAMAGRELVQKEKPLRITYLSYSQIDTFRLCPLHYKLRYVLGVTTPPTPALSFGSSMHAVMQEIYTQVKEGKTVKEKDAVSLLSQKWIREGYTNKRYEEEMKKRGERYLQEYLQKEFDSKATVLSLEQSFTVPISHDGTRIRIGGKIDRIDALPDGRIEIIDYKTGRMPTQREADTNLQLSLYAMAASELPGTVFKRPVDQIVLSLYFFDTQEKLTTTRTLDQLNAEKQTILDIAREIETSDFRCSANPLCASCEYHMFCTT